MSAVPSVLQNHAFSATILNPQPGIAGNWDFDVFLYAHPIITGAIRTVAADNSVLWSPILNPHIPGASYATKLSYLVANVERYRLAYFSGTGYHDAAALSNNGLIAVAQYPLSPVHMSTISHAGDIVTHAYVTRIAELWPGTPKTFEQLQNMPNAYFGAAREGMYAPYKLSETCQDWVDAREISLHISQTVSSSVNTTHKAFALSAATAAEGPYGFVGGYQVNGAIEGTLVNYRSDLGVIHISGKQFAQTAGFTLYLRCGWEMQVAPGSSLTSFSKTSPPYDPVALTSYYAISRELKDAYPADYNDAGKIIRTIAEVASEALAAVFPVGAPLFKGGNAIIRHVVDKLNKNKESSSPSSDPPGSLDSPVTRPTTLQVGEAKLARLRKSIGARKTKASKRSPPLK